MRKLKALDLYALLWAYADAVSIVNDMDEYPSDVYRKHLRYDLGRKYACN